MPIPTTDAHGHESVGSPIRDPIYQPQRKLKVVVIGAGASGLLLAYKLQRHFDNLDLKVFEKHPAVSGVWFENVSESFLLQQCTRRCSFLIASRRTQDVLVTFLLTVSEISRICKAVACSSLVIHRLYLVLRAKDGLVCQLRYFVGDSPILHRLLRSS